MQRSRRWSEFELPGSKAEIRREFENPPDEFRPVPWLCFTGPCEEKQVKKTIGQMYDKGIRAFFIFPIYGLEVEYLSTEWFKLVVDIVEYCAARKMTVWIYDDYNWPNGSCAGKLLVKYPELNTCSYLPSAVYEVQPGKECRIPVFGKNFKTFFVAKNGRFSEAEVREKSFSDPETRCVVWENPLPEPVWCITIMRYSLPKDWGANRGALWLKDKPKESLGFPDLTDPESTAAFIEMTHEQYFKHLKQHFGKTVAGFFDDEPSLFGIHFNPEIERRFEGRYGYELREKLDHLFVYRNEETYRVRTDYWRLVGEMFGGHLERIDTWCEKHHVDSTGHFLGEEEISAEIKVNGSSWNARKNMSVPGMDLLCCHSNYEPVPANKRLEKQHHRAPSGLIMTAKLAAATALYRGVSRVMGEVFGCMPYWVAPVDLAIHTRWLTAMGVNFINDNTLAMSFEGFRKRAVGGRHFTTPWWKHYRDFAEFTGRCAFMAAAGKPFPRVALLYPELTAQALHSFSHKIPVSGIAEKALSERTTAMIQQVSEALVRNHQDWELLFEDILENAEIKNGEIRTQQVTFSALVIPSAHILSERSFVKIEQFAEGGGSVIFIGDMPSISVEKNFDLEARMHSLTALENVNFVKVAKVPQWQELSPELDAILSRNVERKIILSGSGHQEILTSYRANGETEILFFVNMSFSEKQVSAEILGNSQYEIWHPDDGKIYTIPCVKNKNTVKFELPFASWEGYFLVTASDDESCEILQSKLFRSSSDWNEQALPESGWKFIREKPNAAVLNCHVRLDPESRGIRENWQQGMPEDKWLPTADGTMPFKLNPLDSKYLWLKAAFRCEHDISGLGVVVDGSDYDEVYLNGEHLNEKSTCSLWDDANLFFPFGDNIMKNAWNILTVRTEVSNYYHPDVILKKTFREDVHEPIVLVGEFNLKTDANSRSILSTPHETIDLGPWRTQGLANYTGNGTYRRDIEIDDISGETWLDLGETHDTAELKINGKFAGRRCWTPYRFRIDPYLHKGKNTLEISVTSGLGQLLNNGGWEKFTGKCIKPSPSGLLGPVKLLKSTSKS